MKRHRVRLTVEAEEDLLRLYAFAMEKDDSAADRALEAIQKAFELLTLTPYSCRKATRTEPVLRELIIPFGSSGYVALFEIEPPATVTVLAVRHQREDDYH